MAFTTLDAILDRFTAICEGSDTGSGTRLALKPTKDAFTHDRQPNAVLTDAYWIEDAGLGENVEATNDAAVRRDRLTVWVARKLAFAGQDARDALETTLQTLERRILRDGLTQSYHARLEGRRVSRPAGKDFAVASATFSVDYDFSLTVT